AADGAVPAFPTRRSSDLAAILIDLLRAGWDDIAEPLRVPVVRDGRLYRGFRFERTSRLDGQRWELAAVLPAALGDSFDWKGLVRSEEHTSELQSREKLVC